MVLNLLPQPITLKVIERKFKVWLSNDLISSMHVSEKKCQDGLEMKTKNGGCSALQFMGI